jgi:hypothetical protein
MNILTILGFMSVIFTILAYLQNNKKNFLILNTIAVIGLSSVLFLSNGVIGGLTGFWSAFLYFIAIFTLENIKLNQILSITTPIVSCTLYFMLSDGQWENLIPAIAYLFITFSIFQETIIKTKLFLLIGCLVWLVYTLYVGNIFPIIADIIGIFILVRSLYIYYYKNNESGKIDNS